MTILTQTSGGKTRRCDGSCHKAKKPVCKCICGGRYHGKGSSELAQEALTKDFIEDALSHLKEQGIEFKTQGGLLL